MKIVVDSQGQRKVEWGHFHTVDWDKSRTIVTYGWRCQVCGYGMGVLSQPEHIHIDDPLCPCTECWAKSVKEEVVQ